MTIKKTPLTKRRFIGNVASCALFIVALYVLFVAFLALVFSLHDFPEFQVQQSFDVYEGAKLVYERQDNYGSNIALKSLYYWTAAPLANVQAHYEAIFQPFLASDARGNRLITAYNVDGSQPEIAGSHEAICDRDLQYQCVTITLVDLQHADTSDGVRIEYRYWIDLW